MNDEWYFEIGDGQTYGPFPLAKLKKWAAAGNLMPTHRVRRADSSEWIIAAYVPGLEETMTVAEAPPSGPPTAAEPATFRGTIGRVLGRKKKAASEAKEPGEASDADAGPPAESSSGASPESVNIIKLSDEILKSAFERRASDIHIEPEENIVLVQLRADGELEVLRKLPKHLHGLLIGRFKVLSNMDIAERRSPQDGRFRYDPGPDQRKIDIRTVCLPTTHGERMTLRLLAVDTEQLTINRLGMSPAALETFASAMAARQGLILVVGPTGSGKSTTLYAAIRHHLAHYLGKIITVEDPVEFDIVGVAQVDVSMSDSVRFGTALRTILRSDPNVIMIGEIRDDESADIAIKAALTGHLVFSSLHTNSAAGAITRLMNIGIPPYLIAATLRLSIAQRLIRTLCTNCRQPRLLTEAEARAIGHPQAAGTTVYEPGGCDQCRGKGFRGRVGVFELLPIDDYLADQIVRGCDEAQIERYAQQKQYPRLSHDGADKLLAGITSYAELMAASLG